MKLPRSVQREIVGRCLPVAGKSLLGRLVGEIIGVQLQSVHLVHLQVVPLCIGRHVFLDNRRKVGTGW